MAAAALFPLFGAALGAALARLMRRRPLLAALVGAAGGLAGALWFGGGWGAAGAALVGAGLGPVLSPRRRGRRGRLDALDRDGLMALAARTDPDDADALDTLGALLDRHHPGWDRHPRPPDAGERAAARALLGVPADARPDEIRAAHRRLIRAVHPDAGGSAAEAAAVNAARTRLLDPTP